MSNKKYLWKILFVLIFSTGLFSSAYALPWFVVDGANSANSTGPCTGKTICHISGDLTYSDITLQNGGILSHRQGSLIVSNNFTIGTGTTASGAFVGQALSVGNRLLMRGPAILALNSNLISDPASSDITTWMGSSYYDLAVTNTDTAYDGLDVSLTSGGYIKTRNTVVNSRFKLSASSTNVYWNTYAGGYISIDGDANITDCKVDIDGYLFVQGNLNAGYTSSHYLYIRWGTQVAAPAGGNFTQAGFRVDGNMYVHGNNSASPYFKMYATNGTAGDHIYAGSGASFNSIYIGTSANADTPSHITVENGNLAFDDTMNVNRYLSSSSMIFVKNGNFQYDLGGSNEFGGAFAQSGSILTSNSSAGGTNRYGVNIYASGDFTYGITATPTTFYMDGATGTSDDELVTGGNIVFNNALIGTGTSTNIASPSKMQSNNGYIRFQWANNRYIRGPIIAKTHIDINYGDTVWQGNYFQVYDKISAGGNLTVGGVYLYNEYANETPGAATKDLIEVTGNIAFNNTNFWSASGNVNNFTDVNATGSISVNSTKDYYLAGNMKFGGDITFSGSTLPNLATNNITNSGSLILSTITNMTANTITTSGTGLFNTITTLNRNGHITTNNNLTLLSITTSSGTATNLTSTLGNILVSTGTTHTYNNITSKLHTTLTNIATSTINDIVSTDGTITTTTGTTHIYRDLTAKQNIAISGLSSSLTARNLTNSGTTTLSSIPTYQRTGNILTTGDITLSSITTSSGSATNLTSVSGKITMSTGTTHTYNNLSSYGDNTINSIASYKVNNIATNQKLLVSASTLETTNTTDENNEWVPNIDITTGSDFVITNSTGNLRRSSVQVNGGLEVNNTLWTSQNLNINGYQMIGSDKVGIYFRGGKDRYIYGNIFAGGASIWAGTSATTDNGNILLFRNAQVVTNGGIRMYRDTASNVDRFSFLPNATITPNSGIFSQLYNAAALSNSGSVTATGNLIVNPNKLIDEDSNGESILMQTIFGTAVFWSAKFGDTYENIGGTLLPNEFGGATFWVFTFWGGDFSTLKQGNISLFWQAVLWQSVFSGTTSSINTGVEFTLARDMSLSKVCLSATTMSPTAVKMQFRDSLGMVTNTQNLKIQTILRGRQCFDINTARARKVVVTSYPESTMGFKEVELWGVPTDIANIAVSLNDDITLSNGSYELGGNLSAKNLAIASTSGKKVRVVQYSGNGVFDAKSSINLTNVTAGNTLLTHSVGNELGLKFVTDSMTVGTGVLLDTTGKGYLGGNAISELTGTAGGTGNINPGTAKMGAGDGAVYGGLGGYGVSGGGGGGGGGVDGLYSFSSHTFTNCGQTGRTWPALATCKTAYSTTWDENASYFGMTTNGIQEWTVPISGVYRISALWAGRSNHGGMWAKIEGDVELVKGQKLKILVGQQWYNDNASQTEGNGGTFVATIDNQPIIVAGGGGGGYCDASSPSYQSCGQITTAGGNSWNPWYGSSANGWTNWLWWSNYSGGWGGAWFYGNGSASTPAQSFLNGWVWGSYSSGLGWFGGGADTTSWGGGGWGGYSGWGGSYNGSNCGSYATGAWGGSYNNGINKAEVSCANSWHGSVTITKLSSKFETDSVAGAGGGNLGYGGYGGSTTCTGSLGNNTLGNTRGGNGGGATGGSGSNWHGGGGATLCAWGGGGTGGNSDANPYRLGSGGGAGGLLTDDFTTGYGGNGGGMIRISSNTLNLNGVLLANGQTGKNYKPMNSWFSIYGAGGGGAGGSILIRAKALSCNTGNSIEVKGGNGGTGTTSNYGGGGGGGGVITYYYTDKTGTCAWLLSKWLAGASGGAADGQAGLAYESAGTTFDTLKSRVTVENSPAEADGVQSVTIRAYFLDVNGVPLEGEYLVASVVGDLGTGTINGGNPLPQTDANGMLSFPITSTVKGIKKVVLKNAVTYAELQEQPTITFGIPQISIAKTADKSSVNSGDIITYTIALTNSGAGDAGGDVENAIVIEDVLPTGFIYYTAGPTAGSKWDTGSGTTQYYIFPETSGDGTSGNEQRIKYIIADGMSWPAKIAANGGLVRIIFDSKAP